MVRLDFAAVRSRIQSPNAINQTMNAAVNICDRATAIATARPSRKSTLSRRSRVSTLSARRQLGIAVHSTIGMVSAATLGTKHRASEAVANARGPDAIHFDGACFSLEALPI